MKRKGIINNEDGALNIEFMGLLPYIIIIFLVLIQVVGSGYSILLAQKAINESAKVYSITGSVSDAENAVKKIVDSNELLSYEDFSISNEGNGYFTARFTGEHSILIVPKKWRGAFSLPHRTYSRALE